MNIVDVVLIIVGVLNVIFMGFMVSVIKDMVSIKLLITQLHTATATIAARSINQEQLINKLGNSFAEFVSIATAMIDKLDMSGGIVDRGRIYRTPDGKYMGTSVQDLMDKIKADNKMDDYLPLSKDDMDKLRNLFEQDDLDEDEDDDSYDSQR